MFNNGHISAVIDLLYFQMRIVQLIELAHKKHELFIGWCLSSTSSVVFHFTYESIFSNFELEVNFFWMKLPKWRPKHKACKNVVTSVANWQQSLSVCVCVFSFSLLGCHYKNIDSHKANWIWRCWHCVNICEVCLNLASFYSWLLP